MRVDLAAFLLYDTIIIMWGKSKPNEENAMEVYELHNNKVSCLTRRTQLPWKRKMQRSLLNYRDPIEKSTIISPPPSSKTKKRNQVKTENHSEGLLNWIVKKFLPLRSRAEEHNYRRKKEWKKKQKKNTHTHKKKKHTHKKKNAKVSTIKFWPDSVLVYGRTQWCMQKTKTRAHSELNWVTWSSDSDYSRYSTITTTTAAAAAVLLLLLLLLLLLPPLPLLLLLLLLLSTVHNRNSV